MTDINKVDHPAHYGGADDPYEVIKVLEAKLTPEQFKGFCIGNNIKYSMRAENKHGDRDYHAAAWYAQRLSDFLKRNEEREAEVMRKHLDKLQEYKALDEYLQQDADRVAGFDEHGKAMAFRKPGSDDFTVETYLRLHDVARTVDFGPLGDSVGEITAVIVDGCELKYEDGHLVFTGKRDIPSAVRMDGKWWDIKDGKVIMPGVNDEEPLTHDELVAKESGLTMPMQEQPYGERQSEKAYPMGDAGVIAQAEAQKDTRSATQRIKDELIASGSQVAHLIPGDDYDMLEDTEAVTLVKDASDHGPDTVTHTKCGQYTEEIDPNKGLGSRADLPMLSTVGQQKVQGIINNVTRRVCDVEAGLAELQIIGVPDDIALDMLARAVDEGYLLHYIGEELATVKYRHCGLSFDDTHTRLDSLRKQRNARSGDVG